MPRADWRSMGDHVGTSVLFPGPTIERLLQMSVRTNNMQTCEDFFYKAGPIGVGCGKGTDLSGPWKTRKSLIQRARNPDDSQAWEEFVKYYRRFIIHVLNRMHVSYSDMDDLVQNILLKLWKNLGSYDSTQARFRTWLGVVVRNAVFDQFSEIQRERKLVQQEAALPRRLVEQPVSEIEQQIEMEWAKHVTNLAMTRIKHLFSDKAVKVFTMSFRGTPVNDIADQLELPIA